MTVDHSHNFINRLIRYGPIIIWLCIISYASTNQFSHDNTSRFIRPFLKWIFSTQPEEFIDNIHHYIRKLAHFSEYAILSFFICRAFYSSYKKFLSNNWIFWSSFCIIIFALLDEYHQSFEESRTSSFTDSLIDIAGGLVVVFIFFMFNKNNSKKQIAVA